MHREMVKSLNMLLLCHAIENIKEWYKSTDYCALNELHNYGFITKEVLDSYNTYFI